MNISVRNLEIHYGALRAVADVSLEIAPGKLTILVGPNGCGKSTLLRGISGRQALSRGEVRLEDTDVAALSARERARKVALLPQSPVTPEGVSVRTLVEIGRHPHQGFFQRWTPRDEHAVAEAMRRAEVSELADRRVETLSGGQRQRCWLAMALAQETPVLLLDEPTSMLDLGHQAEALDLARRLALAGKTVVVVLHDLIAAARYADVLVAMRDGRVVAEGAPRDVVTSDLIRELYDTDAVILSAPDDGAPIVISSKTPTPEGSDDD